MYTVPSPGKPWWKSRTIWVNLVALAGTVVVGRYTDAQTWAEASVVILAAVNLALRVITGESLTTSPDEKV